MIGSLFSAIETQSQTLAQPSGSNTLFAAKEDSLWLVETTILDLGKTTFFS
jgi:hypothetical protein